MNTPYYYNKRLSYFLPQIALSVGYRSCIVINFSFKCHSDEGGISG
jgi:hypothetical protein